MYSHIWSISKNKKISFSELQKIYKGSIGGSSIHLTEVPCMLMSCINTVRLLQGKNDSKTLLLTTLQTLLTYHQFSY